jgi:hypothetical protein
MDMRNILSYIGAAMIFGPLFVFLFAAIFWLVIKVPVLGVSVIWLTIGFYLMSRGD